MKSYTKYDLSTGKILGSGQCPNKHFIKMQKSAEFGVLEGRADDKTQKVISGLGTQRFVVDKTSAEIERDKPEVYIVPHGEKIVRITNDQYQDLLNRLEVLEAKDV